MNGLQSRRLSPLCLFACFYLQTVCHLCVCVWSLRGTEMCVCVSVNDRVIESTYRENLTTLLHASPPTTAPVSLPPPAQHVCPQTSTPACLKPPHSPGALSSVGGSNTLDSSFYTVERNAALHVYSQHLVKIKRSCNADPTLSTAQSLRWLFFLRYILCVCHVFTNLGEICKLG